MSQMRRSKQEEKDYQAIQALLKEPDNKKCFDCPNKIPSYVNLSIQTFICSRCSGLIREVGHRVKSLTASNFSGPESVALQYGGNAVAKRIWLGHYKGNAPEPESDSDVRWFMRQKYYESKWCDQELLRSHMEKVRDMIKELFNADGQRRPLAKAAAQRQSGAIEPPSNPNNTIRPQVSTTVPNASRKSWVDDNIPIGLSLSSSIKSPPVDLLESNNASQIPSPVTSTSNPPQNLIGLSTPVMPASATQSTPQPKNTASSLFDDLASLQIDSRSKQPLYTGGMLSPSQFGQNLPSRPPAMSSTSLTNVPPSTGPINNSSPTYSSTTSWNYGDPYAVLRGVPEDGQGAMRKTNTNISQRRTSGSSLGRPSTSNMQAQGLFTPNTKNNQFFAGLDPFNTKD